MTIAERIAYVTGVWDGQTMFYHAVWTEEGHDVVALGTANNFDDKRCKYYLDPPPAARIDERFAIKLTSGELARLIDEFYADAANIRIGMPFAYEYVSKKAKGASAGELDDQLRSERRDAN
jgi:hypothetical protein